MKHSIQKICLVLDKTVLEASLGLLDASAGTTWSGWSVSVWLLERPLVCTRFKAHVLTTRYEQCVPHYRLRFSPKNVHETSGRVVYAANRAHLCTYYPLHQAEKVVSSNVSRMYRYTMDDDKLAMRQSDVRFEASLSTCRIVSAHVNSAWCRLSEYRQKVIQYFVPSVFLRA